MANFNVPKLGTFPIAAMFELDNVPVDMSDTGSRWLPSTYDGNKYWSGGPQAISAVNSGADLNWLPYNPRTENNPNGNCMFSMIPSAHVPGTLVNTQRIHNKLYPLHGGDTAHASVSQTAGSSNVDGTSFILNGGYGNSNGWDITDYIYTGADFIPPMSNTLPTPETMIPGEEPPTITGNYTPSSLGFVSFTNPAGRPMPFPLPSIPVVFPNPANGIGALAMRNYSYDCIQRIWEPVAVVYIPIEFIDDTEPCPANPTTDKIVFRIGPSYPTGTPCAYDFPDTVIFIRDENNIPVFAYLKEYDPENEIHYIESSENLGEVVAGRLMEYPITITCDIYARAMFRAPNWDYRLTNNYFNGSEVVENNLQTGSFSGRQANYWTVAQTDGNGWARVFLAAGGMGLATVLTIQDNKILDKQFYVIPLDTGGFQEPVFQWMAQTVGLFPMSGGVDISANQIQVTRRTLEYFNPLPDGGHDDTFTLDGENYLSFSSFIANAEGAYLVAGAAADENFDADTVAFVLRNGKGWYDLDLSDVLFSEFEDDDPDWPLYNSIDYMAFHGGILYIGCAQYDDAMNPGPIKYFAVIPALPRGRLPQVVLDYQAVGISFIPCQTHCLGKGGITSKV